MRVWPMRIASLCLLLAAGAPIAAQEQPDPPAKPLHRFPGLPEPPPAPGRKDGPPPLQLFIAPSGQPFRAPRGQPYPTAQWFAQADTDHDGKLDKPEFRADFERFFDQLDVDHDDVIDSAEITRYEREIVPEASSGPGGFGPFGSKGPKGAGARSGLGVANAEGGGEGTGAGKGQGRGEGGSEGDGQQGPPRGGPPPGGLPPGGPPPGFQPIQGAGMFGIINIPQPIAAMDANLDGRVTRSEMVAAANRRFDLLDSDSRGYLVLRELPRTPAQSGGLKRRRPPGFPG